MPRVLKDGVPEAYNAIEKQIREAHPEITDRREIESVAQARLYKENKGQQWFKVVTK